MKETRLISAGRSNPSNLSNVEAFVKFQAEFMAEFYHPAWATFNVDECRATLNDAKRAGRRLVSAQYSKGSTRGKRDKQYCSVVPFISAAGETICVFYVLTSTDGQIVLEVPYPLPGVLHGHAHRLHQRCHLSVDGATI